MRRWLRGMVVAFAVVLFAAPLQLSAPPAHTFTPRTLVDLAGRSVTIKQPPQRIFLAQPRHFYALMALLEDPTQRLAGWNYPLAATDPDIAPLLEQQWPALKRLPALQRLPSQEINTEALLSEKPDLVVLPLSQRRQIEGSPLARLLDKTATPRIYIDFNQRPLVNASRSLKVLGKALGADQRASQLTALIEQRQRLIRRRLADLQSFPTVLVAITPGIKVDCCRTNIKHGFDDIVTAAGGRNIAQHLPTANSLLSGEWILRHPARFIISTARQSAGPGGVRMGAGVTPADVRHDLNALVQQLPGWQTLPAVRHRRLMAIWHGFHQGPFALIDLEQVAKWLHPQRFADLDPHADFNVMLGAAAPAFRHATLSGSMQRTPYPPTGISQ
ncbi:hypothetical protein R84865_001332 [Carnimonas sp. R-84865]